MKHYYHPMSRAVSTYWMLLELGVEFEQVPVDFMAGENLQREFTSINPMAKIPTLVDGGVVVTEAAAICAYLADKFPEEKLAPPLDSTIRGAYYRYMIYPGATLEPMFTFQQTEVKDYSPQSVGWGDLFLFNTIESMTPGLIGHWEKILPLLTLCLEERWILRRNSAGSSPRRRSRHIKRKTKTGLSRKP